MKRLTISGQTCVEVLALLVTVAWADGRLEDTEKAGIRGAAEVLNLTKEMRAQLELVIAKPVPADQLLFDTLSVKERAFAYVAAAWMSNVDDDVDEKEEELLDKLGTTMGFSAARIAELDAIAKDLGAPGKTGREWSNEIVRLFKAIPPRLEEEADEFEVIID